MKPAHKIKPHHVGILALPGVQLLDVAGPLDVFAEANLQAGFEAYRLSVVGLFGRDIRSSSGVRLVPDIVLAEARGSDFDTFLVAGAPHLGSTAPEEGALSWLAANSPALRRCGSVCSGAVVLAAAGLLDGHRATTHWSVADWLRQHYPRVALEEDAIHVRDGRLRTSAGVTAGLDLALSLVEEDLGPEVARNVASQLVMFFRRPGGQRQFSRHGETNPAGRSALQEIQRWVLAHPAADCTLAALAGRAGLSPRHLARLFRSEVGLTVAAWVEKARIDKARDLLEAGERPKQVAASCGFGDVDTFRRAFSRQLGVTPADYRRRFETPGSGTG